MKTLEEKAKELYPEETIIPMVDINGNPFETSVSVDNWINQKRDAYIRGYEEARAEALLTLYYGKAPDNSPEALNLIHLVQFVLKKSDTEWSRELKVLRRFDVYGTETEGSTEIEYSDDGSFVWYDDILELIEEQS